MAVYAPHSTPTHKHRRRLSILRRVVIVTCEISGERQKKVANVLLTFRVRDMASRRSVMSTIFCRSPKAHHAERYAAFGQRRAHAPTTISALVAQPGAND
jgi:hypothetical protein